MTTGQLKRNSPMHDLFGKFDWAATPLGKQESWPQSLKISVSICLSSKSPDMVLWGPSMIQIYNDAYKEIIGLKHPNAFGAKAQDLWGDLWPEIGPMLQEVLYQGESFSLENHPFKLNRKGYERTMLLHIFVQSDI